MANWAAEGDVEREPGGETDLMQGVGIGFSSPNTGASIRASKPDAESESRRAKERERLLSQLSSGRLSSTKARVAFVLNHYPETRDSDVALTWRYWRTFQHDIVNDPSLSMEEMLKQLERETSIVRVRAKIQNEYGLFLPSKKVRQFRRTKEQEIWLDVTQDKPGQPYVHVYADESGKTQDHVVVGSVWANDSFGTARMWHDLVEWCKDKGIESEFHFKSLSKKDLENAKAFFSEVLGYSHFLSFKAITVNQRGMSRPLDEIIVELYRQLLIQGFEHEFARDRLRPPRFVQIWKDADDGSDRILLAKLRQSLAVAFRDYLEGRVSFYPGSDSIEPIQPVGSRENYFIQVADLFTGSVSRALNRHESRNHKDEFADFVLDALGLILTPDGWTCVGNQDVATVIRL